MRVTARGEGGEFVTHTLVLKMERDGLGGRCVAEPNEAPQREDIELKINELLHNTGYRSHFVRTIASSIGPRGDRLALETCAQGEPLINVLCTRYTLGLAAAVQAMAVMSHTWNVCKDDVGRGVLFDSGVDDIVVAGTTPRHVHTCFVDCHKGRYIGGASMLIRAAARLMVDTLLYTPIGREPELLQALSPEFITSNVLDPLRSVVTHSSPELYLARAYNSVLDRLRMDELGNPWERAGLRQ
jgi:hypothetical protein